VALTVEDVTETLVVFSLWFSPLLESILEKNRKAEGLVNKEALGGV